MKSNREPSKNNINAKSKTPFPTVFENEPDSLESNFNKSSRFSKRVNNLNLTRKSLIALAASNHTDKFAKLKYGEDKEILFNLDCQVKILLDYFQKKCKSELELIENEIAKFDLIDEQGQTKNIQDESIKAKSALLFLEPRKTYILAKIKHNELDEPVTVPLAKTPELNVKAESPSVKNHKKNNNSNNGSLSK